MIGAERVHLSKSRRLSSLFVDTRTYLNLHLNLNKQMCIYIYVYIYLYIHILDTRACFART